MLFRGVLVKVKAEIALGKLITLMDQFFSWYFFILTLYLFSKGIEPSCIPSGIRENRKIQF